MSTRIGKLLDVRREYRTLALMLIVLHFALWGDLGGALSRSLMLTHLGLFLIWQPLWDSDLRLKLSSSVIFVLTAITLVVALDWWVMTFWLLLLIGVVGGRVTLGRTERFTYLAALMFLFAELLIRCIPTLFMVGQSSQQTFTILGYGLLSLPLALYLVPDDTPKTTTSRVDLLYGLLLALLASILASGGLINTFHTGTPYVVALFQTVFGIAVFLLVVSLLSSPRSGFSGLTQLWERHLLNIGTPFEEWLVKVSESAESEATPQQFVDSAMKQLAALPWVEGVDWTADAENGSVGEATGHSFVVNVGNLECRVYANLEVGTTLLLHGKLLIHLIGHFYSAKQRELELANSAHMHAIYETGARVTHDIKNLLQSLHTMTVAVERSGDDPAALALLERQLPNLTQRLQMALDRLQAPARVDVVVESKVGNWWKSLRQRKEREGVVFVETIGANPDVPVDLLDSVVENLLENARVKRQSQPGLRVEVSLTVSEEDLRVSVCDDGTPIERETERHLFQGPVTSNNGLGIGLYQAARQAEQYGFRLGLRESRAGRVCFELERTELPTVPLHPLRRRSDLAGPYAHLVESSADPVDDAEPADKSNLPPIERRRTRN